jgi:hypothetical protein
MTQTQAISRSLDSKSKVGKLTRQIDGLVRQYVSSGSEEFADKATMLSRQREDLLKPLIIRSGKIKEAS